MTMDEIRSSTKDVLTCKDVAPVLRAHEHTLHIQAMQRPELLGFPVIIAGNRVKIPRRAFLRFMDTGDGYMRIRGGE